LKTTLKILDQVNVKFYDLDAFTRRKMVDAMKFFLPHARHTPAYKLGRWDGTTSFVQVSGATFLNLLDKVLPIVMDAGYEVEIDDERPTFEFAFPVCDEFLLSETLWPKGHPAEGEPVMLRDYQVKAINDFFQNPQSMQQISTGAGKTIITGALCKLCEPFGRTITIVPSKSLVVQTEVDYRNIGLDVGVYFGDRKEIGKTHTISTWQSLSAMMRNKDRHEEQLTLEDMIDGVNTVIVDEAHSAKGNDLQTMLAGPLAHIPIRWGLTGTIPKDEVDQIRLLSCIGPVVGNITAKELQDQGVLSQCQVNILQLKDDHVEFKSYQEEKDFLTSDSTRLAWMAKLARGLAEDGNTLILIDRIETGHALQAMIPDSVFINGSVKNATRKEEYDSIQEADNKVLIATYGVAAVGINIPRIFHLVLIEPGKSFVRVIQSIGRGIRKAKDKDHVDIWDLTSTLKFSAKHMKARKVFYKDAAYPHTVEKIDYRNKK
jgi:superfamily II DNA or RNA helicase